MHKEMCLKLTCGHLESQKFSGAETPGPPTSKAGRVSRGQGPTVESNAADEGERGWGREGRGGKDKRREGRGQWRGGRGREGREKGKGKGIWDWGEPSVGGKVDGRPGRQMTSLRH